MSSNGPSSHTTEYTSRNIGTADSTTISAASGDVISGNKSPMTTIYPQLNYAPAGTTEVHPETTYAVYPQFAMSYPTTQGYPRFPQYHTQHNPPPYVVMNTTPGSSPYSPVSYYQSYHLASPRLSTTHPMRTTTHQIPTTHHTMSTTHLPSSSTRIPATAFYTQHPATAYRPARGRSIEGARIAAAPPPQHGAVAHLGTQRIIRQQAVQTIPSLIPIQQAPTTAVIPGYPSPDARIIQTSQAPVFQARAAVGPPNQTTQSVIFSTPMAAVQPITKSSGRSTTDFKGKRNRRRKSPGAPKHPSSPFLHFAKASRNTGQKRQRGGSMIELGKTWREMSAEDKKCWEEVSAKDKERYAKQKSEYFKRKAMEKSKKQKIEAEKKAAMVKKAAEAANPLMRIWRRPEAANSLLTSVLHPNVTPRIPATTVAPNMMPVFLPGQDVSSRVIFSSEPQEYKSSNPWGTPMENGQIFMSDWDRVIEDPT
ncbi:hypothetical protein AAMO2058_000865100 [Amorphochlora amoebiformis]